MSLDLGKTLGQLQAAMGEVSESIVQRNRTFADRLALAMSVAPEQAIARTANADQAPFAVARTGPEGLLASIPAPAMPDDWAAVSVDGSHIDVDRHLPLSCFLINLGGCAIEYGQHPSCTLFSEPDLAVRETELYYSGGQNQPPDTPSDTPIAGPLLGALRTVREVEKLADTVAATTGAVPTLALVDGTLAFRDVQSGNYPGYLVQHLIEERLQPALDRLFRWSQKAGNLTVAAYTSRPRTNEVVGAMRVCLCERDLTLCAERCNARRSDLGGCEKVAGFNDRQLFEYVLESGHRSPVYESGRRQRGASFGHTWVNFFYVHAGEEIARVEVPEWVAGDPRLLGLTHAMVVAQCELGKGYPVVISEAHEQAVVNARDRLEFRNAVLKELEKYGLPAIESAKNTSKRRPWV
jgi:hypothetical protein